MDPSIKPFKIDIHDDEITWLRKKLELANLPDKSPVSDSWDYGVPVSDMKRLVEHWKNGYNWRQQETALNQLPQFTTPVDVDGVGPIDIHFVHQKSGRKGAIPLLFCHGCKLALPETRVR